MKKITKKQNVGMVFDEDSKPIAIYWKNGSLKFFSLKEMNERDMDLLMEADTLPDSPKEIPGFEGTNESIKKITIINQ